MTPVLFVGQAPPQVAAAYPFARSRLYQWLETIGWGKESVLQMSHFAAVLEEWPGRIGKTDRAPTSDEIVANRVRLAGLVERLQPRAIVAVGAIAAQSVLCLESPPQLNTVVGSVHSVAPFGVSGQVYPVVALPHPSGLSTWIYQPGNQALLESSLRQLKKYL